MIKRVTSKLGLIWLSLLTPLYVHAQDVPTDIGSGVNNARPAGVDEGTNLLDIIDNIISTLLLLVGIFSVIMLIVGGIRYVVSAGNQDQVQGAKNTIVYALLGLVISILAYAIVKFIVGQFE